VNPFNSLRSSHTCNHPLVIRIDFYIDLRVFPYPGCKDAGASNHTQNYKDGALVHELCPFLLGNHVRTLVEGHGLSHWVLPCLSVARLAPGRPLSFLTSLSVHNTNFPCNPRLTHSVYPYITCVITIEPTSDYAQSRQVLSRIGGESNVRR